MLAVSSEDINNMVDKFKKRFQDLKNQVRECLEKHQIHKMNVADVLMSLSPDDNEHHKIFSESHVALLVEAANISEQFGTMNFHWNYINPPLLDHLVEQFNLEIRWKHTREICSSLEL